MARTDPFHLCVAAHDAGMRLDRYCAARMDALSRNQIQRLNTLGGILVDGQARPDSYVIREGDTVELRPSLLEPEGLEGGLPRPQDIPVAVVYEDEHIVVVNKPAGMVVHPAHGNRDGTLVNALLGRGVELATLGAPDRPGIVHRLDKDTSGVMVVARSDEAHHALAEALRTNRVEKTYHAIVHGSLSAVRTTVDAPIGRHPVRRQEMAVVERSGKPARSDLFVVDRYMHFDYIRVVTHTGRTHQIRVHLTHIGHPVLGDPVYGGRKLRGPSSRAQFRTTFDTLLKILPRHALHASMLSFAHPVTGLRMNFVTALPEDMRLALETLQREDRTKEVTG